jgi:hypothetical protein
MNEKTHVWTEPQKAWLVALRSGKYKQARYQLMTSSGFCCLGVACDISGLGVWNNLNEYVNTHGLVAKGSLPNYVRDWLGLWDNCGRTLRGGSLADLNDELGWTFEEIANFIEKNPEEIFTEAATTIS